MSLPRLIPVVAGAALLMVACGDDSSQPLSPQDTELAFSASVSAEAPETFLMIARSRSLPRNLEAQVSAFGGKLVRTVPEIGLAVVEADASGFRSRASGISGIRSVVPDYSVRLLDPEWEERAVSVEQVENPPFSGSDQFLFDLQWGHAAIEAPLAWTTGARGAGVRVAVLDTGILPTHVDLAPNVNTDLSTSFVPGETFDSPPGSHGTHVSGTIAAADVPGGGVIGVAPEAEIVAVKVLSAVTGDASFAGLAEGLVYAANIGSDIINMSLGARVMRSGAAFIGGEWVEVPAEDVAAIILLTQRAVTFASQAGVTIISSAGNLGTHRNFTRDVVVLPADLPGVISVSATGPMGWALDFETDLDRLASYSEHGKARIDFAAPGGDFVLPGNDPCTVGIVLQFCWVFDLVMSTSVVQGGQGWAWNAGTSMASPHVAGVAALIIGEHGGAMHPAQVEAQLRRSADDLGKPGKNDEHGHGRVNAARAVGAM